MNDDAPFNPPKISDGDICWAASLLGLPENAFHGEDDKDPRLEILKCMESTDVAACPGSGKTTLLVAKLAILAKKWEHRTRGICVLSHTNAARREIEKRLGSTSVGRQLLSYPHYIGTIHGFVNAFLALPWLRSLGYPIKMISTKICLERRWNSLSIRTQVGLEKNYHSRSVLTIRSSDFDVGRVRWGRGYLSSESATYRNMLEVCKKSAVEGCFCYDEMFMWADMCMEQLPDIVSTLRDRFPVLFIDEAQDNGEEQSNLLHRIFTGGDGEVLRQRFGDSDQAIFNFTGARGATTDLFPNPIMTKSVTNSHRFGQAIARLAEPLSFDSYEGGLNGNGPRPICTGSTIASGPHTIFLFQDDTVDKVLPAYAELLVDVFSEEELENGTFTAVGQVHNDNRDDNLPRHVGHYWPDYDSELSKTNPQPSTFVQYLRTGLEKVETTGEVYYGIEKVAQGILRLSGMAEDRRDIRQRLRSHRYVLELLENEKRTSNLYHLLIRQLVVKRKKFTKDDWSVAWAERVRKIGEKVAGASLANVDVKSFLEWPSSKGSDADGSRNVRHDNFYCYPVDCPKVRIRVGSIHSVKGQTHTATLVMETFWYKHNLESIKEWLSGSKNSVSNLSSRDTSRLKVHYVAMTRPTHLLCLAMKRNSFDKILDIEGLREYGWRITYV